MVGYERRGEMMKVIEDDYGEKAYEDVMNGKRNEENL